MPRREYILNGASSCKDVNGDAHVYWEEMGGLQILNSKLAIIKRVSIKNIIDCMYRKVMKCLGQ